MAAGVAPGITDNEGLMKINAEKAALLIESHDIISVQYALTDNRTIGVSGQIGKNDKPLT